MVNERNNVLFGVLGAVLGALIGGLLWIGVSMLGFIAGIAGFAVIFFATKGYKILGGTLDKKGGVISIIISMIVIFGADYMAYVIDIYKIISEVYNISFSEVFKEFPSMMSEFDGWPEFIKDLLIGYGLTIWASFTLLKSLFAISRSEKVKLEEYPEINNNNNE